MEFSCLMPENAMLARLRIERRKNGVAKRINREFATAETGFKYRVPLEWNSLQALN